jgi:hypothetical protein
MNYVFLSGKFEQDRYLKAIARGIGAKTVYTRHYIGLLPRRNDSPIVKTKKVLPGTTSITLSGLLRGNAHILNLALENNITFYYVDHAYFNSGYKKPFWMRIVKNGFMQNTIIPNVSESRLRENFNVNFLDYKFKDNRNIVVLPPSDTVARVFNQTAWERNTIEKIRANTDRPIVVRKKSGPVMDKSLINIVKKETYVYDETIEETLSNAYCVVAFNSSLALTALEKGIPVICERYCPAYALSHSFDSIENLKEKDRLPLFASLAWGQFDLNEAENQKTFDYINRIQQWKGHIR